MHVVHLLLQSLWAADPESRETKRSPEEIQKKIDTDMERIRKKVSDVRDENAAARAEQRPALENIELPCEFPGGKKVVYTENEFKEILQREKAKQNKDQGVPADAKKDDDTEKIDYGNECCICFQPLVGRANEDSFIETVNKTHNQLPIIWKCPMSTCTNGRAHKNCILEAIKSFSETDIHTYTYNGNPISKELMVKCVGCTVPMNFRPEEFNNRISSTETTTDDQKLNFIEDMMFCDKKTLWLLELSKLDKKDQFKENIKTVSEFQENKLAGKDASEKLLLNDLYVQLNFYRACTEANIKFENRVSYIKEFIRRYRYIEDGSEHVYPFISKLREQIATSGLPFDTIENHFKDICSVVPIEHADKYANIFSSMIEGYFMRTKDSYTNRMFITRWILSKYSFFLTGFKHCPKSGTDNSIASSEYYPFAIDFYCAFGEALNDPRLIDNVIKYNALEFTFKGLGYYPREVEASREFFISYLIDEYYEKYSQEKGAETFNGRFVQRHNADVRRFTYPVYKQEFERKKSAAIIPTDFNESIAEKDMMELPAFMFDAILKVLFISTAQNFGDTAEKVTSVAVFNKDWYNNCNGYADYHRETNRDQKFDDYVSKNTLIDYLENEDYEHAIYLFKNLSNAFQVDSVIEKFKNLGKLNTLIEGINRFEFVNCENEKPIYEMLKAHSPGSVTAMLERMSKQSSCYYGIPSAEIDAAIRKIATNKKSIREIGSLAFVCRNDELLKSFENSIDGILDEWDFVSSFKKFFDGTNSLDGTENIPNLPFFQMYYSQLFAYIDKKIDDKDVGFKVSMMLGIAKLAMRELIVENGSANQTESEANKRFGVEVLKAAAKTKVGYEAVCACYFYISKNFKTYLNREVLGKMFAIEVTDKSPLLKADEYRFYYRKLLKLQSLLNESRYTTTEAYLVYDKEMHKLLEVLRVLKMIEATGALNAIKKQGETQGETKALSEYTDEIFVLPRRIFEMAFLAS
ncbi:hypothetical protein ENBRE01_2365 [Enteropsectra breve]|nr:hypothetical protein ENBRE01_2365 [Enteropsectra breve]